LGVTKGRQRLGKGVDYAFIGESGDSHQDWEISTSGYAELIGHLLRPFPSNSSSWIVSFCYVDQLNQSVGTFRIDQFGFVRGLRMSVQSAAAEGVGAFPAHCANIADGSNGRSTSSKHLEGTK
jgi:hypothetical protein